MFGKKMLLQCVVVLSAVNQVVAGLDPSLLDCARQSPEEPAVYGRRAIRCCPGDRYRIVVAQGERRDGKLWSMYEPARGSAEIKIENPPRLDFFVRIVASCVRS